MLSLFLRVQSRTGRESKIYLCHIIILVQSNNLISCNIAANRNTSTNKDAEEGLPAIASNLSWTKDKCRKVD